MFNFVRLSDGGPPRLEGPRGEVEVIAEIAHRVLADRTPLDWQVLRRHDSIRQLIGQVIPGFAALREIDRTRREFQIEGRTFHQPRFATADGRAQIFIHELPDLAGGPGDFRLMTLRSEGQFNTVVYEEEDLYRGQSRRDVVLIHPDDVRRRGWRDGQRVSVVSEAGRMDGVQLSSFADIKPGNVAMYYPEANALVPRRVDPLSRTPAFKNVVVTIEPHAAAPLASYSSLPRSAAKTR